mmetsp:Transcript_12993/g.40000  ORF Transcript_12993/g.40000 Transcript_12993/m.40000 type:complete len:222 (+) Transcript_12993:2338-3003(+)
MNQLAVNTCTFPSEHATANLFPCGALSTKGSIATSLRAAEVVTLVRMSCTEDDAPGMLLVTISSPSSLPTEASTSSPNLPPPKAMLATLHLCRSSSCDNVFPITSSTWTPPREVPTATNRAEVATQVTTAFVKSSAKISCSTKAGSCSSMSTKALTPTACSACNGASSPYSIVRSVPQSTSPPGQARHTGDQDRRSANPFTALVLISQTVSPSWSFNSFHL